MALSALLAGEGRGASMANPQAVRATQKEAAFERQEAMIARMKRFIDRFGTHVAKAAQAQSRQKKIDKIERLDPPHCFRETGVIDIADQQIGPLGRETGRNRLADSRGRSGHDRNPILKREQVE